MGSLELLCRYSNAIGSEQMGHASTAFTLDTYAHVLARMQEDSAARIEGKRFWDRGMKAN